MSWLLSRVLGTSPTDILWARGAGGRFGAIHSQTPVSWFLGVPGLKIVCPATPGDAKGLLKSAIRDDNPVLFLEHKRLYSLKGDAGDEPIPLGQASVVRTGNDLTIVTAMKGVHDALAAAEELSRQGIEATVIDLRTLRPLDTETILESVRQTNRLLVVEEGPETGGWAGEVLARVTEHALGDLDAAWRLTTADLPIPYSPPLEDAFLPGPDAIVESVRARLGSS
jgi:pyruvate/2-oxoglutarate/acetoin dehydrogenase E1 component